ncbi:hypothetical protein F5Y14DRAFT_368973 [Nemania sp. NC0429]|nr:hypothetical protein F5Y14DRAFT_368973 [Nemania sp. NC0429]
MNMRNTKTTTKNCFYVPRDFSSFFFSLSLLHIDISHLMFPFPQHILQASPLSWAVTRFQPSQPPPKRFMKTRHQRLSSTTQFPPPFLVENGGSATSNREMPSLSPERKRSRASCFPLSLSLSLKERESVPLLDTHNLHMLLLLAFWVGQLTD